MISRNVDLFVMVVDEARTVLKNPGLEIAAIHQVSNRRNRWSVGAGEIEVRLPFTESYIVVDKTSDHRNQRPQPQPQGPQ